MKIKKHSQSSSSRVKHLSSSQASRALLEASTETFNTNSTISITSDDNKSLSYEYSTRSDDIEQELNLNGILRSTSKRNRCIKLYLKPLIGILILITIVSIIIAILCYFDNFIIQSKQITNQTIKQEQTIAINHKKSINSTASSLFKWNHCGQTFYNPSISPHYFKKIRKRIIGGEDAVKHSWPFLASVRIKLNNKSEHQCGGTLITDQHILTAAHCIFPYLHLVSKLKMNISEMFSLIEVHVGINEHEKDPQDLTKEHVYMVENFDFHENFNFNEWTLIHDIAIMKLKRKVNLDRPEVNIVCLPSNNPSSKLQIGENVVAIGWGSYAEEFNYTAYVLNQLQQAMFTVVDQDNEMCNSGMIGNKWDRNYTICANGNDKKRVTCFGDSGGPVLAYRNKRWTLVGIISFAHDIKDYQTNKKKCNASMPFYFVNVKAYVDWINKRIGNDVTKLLY